MSKADPQTTHATGAGGGVSREPLDVAPVGKGSPAGRLMERWPPYLRPERLDGARTEGPRGPLAPLDVLMGMTQP